MAFKIDAATGAHRQQSIRKGTGAPWLYIGIVADEAQPVLGAIYLYLFNITHQNGPCLVVRRYRARADLFTIHKKVYPLYGPAIIDQCIDIDLLILFHYIETIWLRFADDKGGWRIVNVD